MSRDDIGMYAKATMYHYTKDGDRDKIGSVFNNIAFNVDNTQAVFATAMDDIMYIYDAKREKSEAYTVLDVQGGGTMSPVCDDALYGYGYIERTGAWSYWGETTHAYMYFVRFTNAKDLKKCFYTRTRGSDTLYGLWAIDGDRTGILLSGLMFLDWFILFLGIRESTNLRRLLTGILGGFGYTTLHLYFYSWLVRLLRRERNLASHI